MNFLYIFFVFLYLGIHCSKCSMEKLWEKFKIKYEKIYEHEEHENGGRRNFDSWVHEVLEHNMNEDKRYLKGINSLADMSHEDISNTKKGALDPFMDEDFSKRVDFSNRTSKRSAYLDYSTQGIMSDVKDQGYCGCCWAFAATEAVESYYAMRDGSVPVLSPQELLDCSNGYGNNGCGGGYLSAAFNYLAQNGGSETDDCYPYEGNEESCRINDNCQRYQISDYISVSPSGDEDALLNALTSAGPIAVTIFASNDFHQISLDTGVFYDDNCNDQGTNHIVLLVGYGTQDGKDYWKIRNSWGTGWGDQGYGLLARNYNNMCQIASYASYPVL